MNTLAVALCLVLMAMASATYPQGGGYGRGGNDIWNNQYPKQVANINQQQSNKQYVDQDQLNRGGRFPYGDGYGYGNGYGNGGPGIGGPGYGGPGYGGKGFRY
ncbi:sulfur globule protein CV2-like [Haliotis cracherodii]|uniref:sulfur globule protein CV2-like n=1 Tax=Haliotis cracherodii TaxID=6455 RepID=UPI0039E909F1